MSIINVQGIEKEYKVRVSRNGIVGALKSLIKPIDKRVEALRNVSFKVSEGEFVGLIGENGAGKSTLIKIMSGILHPTSGEVHINGIIPYKNRKENARNIGVVFGQRTRLIWELPMTDSFELYKEIYRIPPEQYKANVDAFITLLDMGAYIQTPVRHLSLGQRMRAEIALSMLHSPDLLFLDEPTIGLDVVGKKYIRDFFSEINRERKTTIILTSHDMKDFDSLVSRTILLNKGSIIFDGTLDELKRHHSVQNYIVFSYETEIQGEILKGVVSNDRHQLKVLFNAYENELPELFMMASKLGEITDVNIKSEDIEDLVRKIYQ